MGADAPQREWVGRVLGFADGEHADAGGKLLPIWVAAKDEVDAAVSRLQQHLVRHGHPDLRTIAEYGLYGVTERSGVGLMAALRDLDAGGADSARQRAAEAIAAFRAFLANDTIAGLIEGNPFGVPVPLRATLGHALDALDHHLAA